MLSEKAAQDAEFTRCKYLAERCNEAGDYEKALYWSRLPTSKKDPEAIMQRLEILQKMRRFEAAAELASTVLVDADHFLKKAVLGAMTYPLLALGAREGDMAAAFKVLFDAHESGRMHTSIAQWTGQPLQGKSILVTHPFGRFGGHGDAIMLARFLPILAQRGARIVIQCNPLLARLFCAIPCVFSVCAYEDNPPCDFTAPLTGLPHLLGLRQIPHTKPFNIHPLPMPEGVKSVGINWGASWVASYMDRTCALAELMPLTTIEGVQLYSLQKGNYAKQLYPAPAGMNVFDLAPRLNDFLDTANMLASLDAVVTTDSVVANLSCMLGRPTFALVPKLGDFRWGDGAVSPWFPTARVYRQETAGDWSGPISKLTADLEAFLSSTKEP